MPAPISSRLIGKVSSPGVLLISASQMVPLMRALASRRPLCERAQRVVEAFRLDGVELGRRHARLDAERNAGGQARRRRRRPPRSRASSPGAARSSTISRADGALPGDDQRIVVRRHQRGAALGDDVLGDGRAVLGVAVVEHDLGAERRGALALRARRVGRHHDGGAACRAGAPPPPRLARDCRTNRPPRRRRGAPAGIDEILL